ncbi:DUF6934 family protein [Dyadobacter sp.]|uniref:DUF6934 family protein n=1 Tax=Dyadobacter sp. TaxID=1914288 RepID=UPI003F707EAC
MDQEAYQFSLAPNKFRYYFDSTNGSRKVRKVVLFTESEHHEVYNLALLDTLEDGKMSDQTETRNGDMITVLATVYQIVIHFLEQNNTCSVFFRGSDVRRHRLYRIIIGKYYRELSVDHAILGLYNKRILPFQTNQSCDYYIIEKKL